MEEQQENTKSLTKGQPPVVREQNNGDNVCDNEYTKIKNNTCIIIRAQATMAKDKEYLG